MFNNTNNTDQPLFRCCASFNRRRRSSSSLEEFETARQSHLRRVLDLHWTDSSGCHVTYNGDVCAMSNVPHGSGVARMDNGDVYEGHWVGGKKSGYGTYSWSSGARYDGDFRDDEFHGRGAFHWPNGEYYVGQFENGEMHGFGCRVWPDGACYTGEYVNGKRSRN